MVDHGKFSTIVISVFTLIVSGVLAYFIGNPSALQQFLGVGMGEQLAAMLTPMILGIMALAYNAYFPRNPQVTNVVNPPVSEDEGA